MQTSLPYDVNAQPPLPGIAPLDPAQWLIADEAFAGQMRLRDQLLAEAREAVLQMDACAREAAVELLDMVLDIRHPGAFGQVTRADGVEVVIDRDDPLATLGHLVQEDFCLLHKIGKVHVLTGAVLCFPASWMLAEKFMAPLIAIHDPVQEYDPSLARRVQRLFDGVRAGRPMWRFNALWYEDPALFQPRQSQMRRQRHAADTAAYLRSERQSILRLPKTDAVVFSIHTFVVPRSAVVRTA